MEANHLKPTSINGIRTVIVLWQPNNDQSRLAMFSAAASADNSTRNFIIALVHNYAASNLSATALGMVYDAMSGEVMSGMNSPAAGAMFAPLVLRCSHLD